jgi:fumarate reductase subunit D
MEKLEDGNLDELVAAFKQLENISPTGVKTVNSMIANDSTSPKWKLFLSSYGVYVIFLFYLIIVIAVLQPYFLFKKNEESQKYKFLWKRFFFTLLICYVVLVGLYIGFQVYISKSQ